MARNAVKPVIAFECGRYLRDRMTWVGIAGFAFVLMIGAIDYWNALPPRPDGSRMFSEAYLVALALAFHASIAQDRAHRFDAFLVSNFVTASVVYFGKAISAALFLVGLATVAFILALAFSLGDISYAARHTMIFLAGSFVLLPVVILFELAVDTRYTVPLIIALFFALTAILHASGDLPGFIDFMGFGSELTLARGVARTFAVLGLTVAFYPLYRWRLGLKR